MTPLARILENRIPSRFVGIALFLIYTTLLLLIFLGMDNTVLDMPYLDVRSDE